MAKEPKLLQSGIDMASGDSIEVITRYQRGGLVAYSIDGGKTFHPTTGDAIRAKQKSIDKLKNV